jgi:acyl-CoA thioesterase-1
MIVLALGANDALRGLKVEETEKNLSEAIEIAQKAGVKVALASMLAPPNYGKKFADDFGAIFPRLKKKYSVILIPFLLEGVAGDSKLNISDGIHPNERGHQIIAQTVFKALEASL